MRPNSGPATSGSGSVSELSLEECYRLIGQDGIGRIALCTDDGPIIIPVNYIMENEAVIVRTAAYSVLGEHAQQDMAFEVDSLHQEERQGWSVVLVGKCERIEDIEQMTELRASRRLEPWAAGSRHLFIRLTPRRVTGRRIG